MTLTCGKHYWVRHKVEQIWHPCYLQKDKEGDVWLLQINSPPLELSTLNKEMLEFKELPTPLEEENKDLYAKIRVALAEIYEVDIEKISEDEVQSEALRVEQEGYGEWEKWHEEMSEQSLNTQENKA